MHAGYVILRNRLPFSQHTEGATTEKITLNTVDRFKSRIFADISGGRERFGIRACMVT